jgi:drug/metabolite transporter (DMT)-like permease
MPPHRSYFIAGIFICLLGAICFSTKAIFVKLAYRDTSIDALPLLALRMIFSLPFFIISAIVASSKSNNVRFTLKQWLYIAFIGCLGYYVSSLLDFIGLRYVSAGIERLILFIYPTLVLLLSSFVFKEKIASKQWLAVSVTYIGLFIAFMGEARIESTTNQNFYWGATLIFACAITYACYIVGSGRLIPQVGAAKFNSYAMTFACIAVLLHFMLTSDESLFGLPTIAYVYSALMALLSTVIPSYLVTEGIKRIGSDNAAIVGSVGPVSTIIQANIFLQEPVMALQIAGTILVLIGIVLIGNRKKLS